MSDQIPAFPVTEKAYAKLNISLDVTARRSDGYHDMLMLMQTVSLCDELTITPERDGLVHAVTSLPYVPGDRRNLAVRAALKFLELVGDGDRGMKIAIRKSIPVGAGMAGGSADAAAVLRRGGAKPGGAGRESGRGGDGGRSQLCSGDPHCGWEGTGSMAGAGRRGAGVGPRRGWGRASPLSSRGSPWRLGTPTACAPGSPRIGIQWARRRGADHRSGNWDCVEQGTT